MKKTKNVLIAAFLVMLALSCGTESSRDAKTLIYWSSNNSAEIKFAKQIVNEWNKINPDSTVKSQPVPEGQSSEEIILAAVVGKTTPDVYSNMWQGDVEFYAQSGVLVALDTLQGFNDFIYARCDSFVVEEVRSQDGHIYQLPWKINPIMMIYNKNILNNLGLESPPKTYSQFFDAAEKFQKDLDGDGYIDQWFGYTEVLVTWWQRFFDFYPLYLAASNGGSLVKNGKAVFNNKYALEVFSFLRTLYEENYFPKERLSARQDVFLSGTIATRFTGPWDIAHTEKYKPEGFEYGFSTMPAPNGHNGPVYTYGDPKNIVIFNTCPNPELAWEFIKYMTSKKNDYKFLKISNQIPRRKDLSEDSLFVHYFNTHPKMKSFARQSKFVKGTDSSPVLKEVFDIISQEYEACVIYGRKSPQEALDDAEKAVNLLFLE